MFFSDSELVLELLGIFKIRRESYIVEKSNPRSYDTLSMRRYGSGKFEFENQELSVSKNELLYISSNAVYSQKTDGEEIIAVHFINYNKNIWTKLKLLMSIRIHSTSIFRECIYWFLIIRGRL